MVIQISFKQMAKVPTFQSCQNISKAKRAVAWWQFLKVLKDKQWFYVSKKNHIFAPSDIVVTKKNDSWKTKIARSVNKGVAEYFN